MVLLHERHRDAGPHEVGLTVGLEHEAAGVAEDPGLDQDDTGDGQGREREGHGPVNSSSAAAAPASSRRTAAR